MSLQKVTIKNIIEKKQNGKKITSITAYDYSFAKIVDESDFDIILVGDSLAMVVLGYENTLSVTMDEMIHHTKAVARGVSNSLLVGDMPYLSYKVDKRDALYNAGRFIQEGGAEAVKVEGGTEMCTTIKAMINADIQVMGHIGLTPQSIYKFGGFMVQGRTMETAKRLILDAKNLEKTGVFSIVLESIPWQIAKLITEAVNIPTIGIGAGPYCDGQIIVINDMLGLYKEIKPKFLKYFGDIGTNVREALQNYKTEIINQKYPTLDYSYDFPERNIDDLQSWFEATELNKEAEKLKKEIQ
jgi:3-methyl-2-oxobutanoate hydroxymethyltransferase